MLIQCTKALLDKIHVAPGELLPPGGEDLPDSLRAWHANLISINRRKAIILMNNQTRYPVVIYRPKPRDFGRFKELIKQAIVTALHMEGFSREVIEGYMAASGEIEFSKTGGRSLVSKMNKAADEIQFLVENLDESSLIQRYISLAAGRMIHDDGSGEGIYPIEEMEASLNLYGSGDSDLSFQEVLEVECYQLKIAIALPGHDIYRRVLVPATFSFRHLHTVIQIVFDWLNYHLHSFTAAKPGSKDKLIVMDDDPDTLDWIDRKKNDILQDRFCALEDIFPTYQQVGYLYDFGDSWEHVITFEKNVKAKGFQVIYLEGRGDRPPEDVGGAGGYEEYLQVMADPGDPEYESMVVWSESQSPRQMSPEEINRRLKNFHYSYRYSPSYY